MADQSLLLSVSVTYNDMIIRWASLQLQALDILDGKSLSQVLTPPSCLRFGTLPILRFGTLPNLRQVREPSALVSEIRHFVDSQIRHFAESQTGAGA